MVHILGQKKEPAKPSVSDLERDNIKSDMEQADEFEASVMLVLSTIYALLSKRIEDRVNGEKYKGKKDFMRQVKHFVGLLDKVV